MLKREIDIVSRLATNLRTYVERSISEEYFTKSSHAFFSYVGDLCRSVNSYLVQILGRLETHQYDTRTERLWANELSTIKKILGAIHKLVKNTTEAPILKIPYPLVTLINRITKNITGVAENTQVLVMSTDQYSFYHDPIMNIRTIEAPHIFSSFPRNQGFISFPFLESKNLLENCNLLHELGHYVYFLLDVDERIGRDLTNLLDLKGSSDIEAETMRGTVLREDMFAADRLERRGWNLVRFWAREIFSDFLASRVIGPAFFYNFWLLQHSLPLVGMNSFEWRHPAFFYRLSKMYTFLYEEGWSDPIKTHTPEVYQWVRDHCSVEGREIRYDLTQEVSDHLESHQFCQWLLKRFNDLMIPYLDEYVKEITLRVAASREDFVANHRAITDYLEHFIVPSVLVDSDGGEKIPSYSTLLTSATIFYFNSMEKWKDLLENIEELDDLTRHSFFFEKLNDFIIKAMTDMLILRNEDGSNR